MKINNKKISEPFISPPRRSRKLEVKTACIEVHHLIYKEESLAACGGACFLNTEMGKKRHVNQPSSRLFSPPLQLVLSEPANRDGQKAAQYVLSL